MAMTVLGWRYLVKLEYWNLLLIMTVIMGIF